MKKTIGYLLIESMLITFSILFAFWLENLKQNREDIHVKQEYYGNLLNDLKTDSIQFQKILKSTEEIDDVLIKISKTLKSNKVNIDTLAFDIWRVEADFFLADRYTFSSEAFTLNSLTNSGQIRLFERDTVFTHLQSYYILRNRYSKATQDYVDIVSTFLTPYLIKNHDRRILENIYSKEQPPIKLDMNIKNFQTREFNNILSKVSERLVSTHWTEFLLKTCQKRMKEIRETQNLR